MTKISDLKNLAFAFAGGALGVLIASPWWITSPMFWGLSIPLMLMVVSSMTVAFVYEDLKSLDPFPDLPRDHYGVQFKDGEILYGADKDLTEAQTFARDPKGKDDGRVVKVSYRVVR